MFFWQIYSRFYEKLSELIPYQELKKQILSYVNIPSNGMSIDLGCGVGLLMDNRPNMIGIDLSKQMLQVAANRNPRSSLVVGDLNNSLPFQDQAFNVAICNNVLAYLKNPEEFAREIFRILKPDARLIISTLRPSFNPFYILWRHIKKSSAIKILQQSVLIFIILLLNFQIILKLKRGIYHGFELEEMRALVESNGFEVLKAELAYTEQDVLIVAQRRP